MRVILANRDRRNPTVHHPSAIRMLYLRTFGGLAIENGGRPIIGAAAQRGRLAILAVLAVAGETGISRDRLLALFWPDSDTERARGALRQALYAIRRDVGEQELTVGTSELRLNSNVISSDIAEFEGAMTRGDLNRAVCLYAGAFLDGVHVKDALELERWIERERERFAFEYRSAVERLVQSCSDQGDVDGAVGWARRLSAADSLSSRAARALMLALAAAGHREAAIRHGQTYAELVRTELGANPDPSILELADQLRLSNGMSIGNAVSVQAADVEPAAYRATVTEPKRPAKSSRIRRRENGDVSVLRSRLARFSSSPSSISLNSCRARRIRGSSRLRQSRTGPAIRC